MVDRFFLGALCVKGIVAGALAVMTSTGLTACDNKTEIPIGYRIILLEDKQQQVEAKVIKVTKKMCPHEEQVQFLLPSGAVTEYYKENAHVVMDIMVMDTTDHISSVNVVNGDKSYVVNIVI